MQAESVLWVALIVFGLAVYAWRCALKESAAARAMTEHYLGETKRAFVLMRGGNSDEAIAVLNRAAKELNG